MIKFVSRQKNVLDFYKNPNNITRFVIDKRKKLHGTFQLNKDIPIHSWYSYITGYSANLVAKYLDIYKIRPGEATVLDPFVGVGTTSVVCKQNGIKSIGIEINPFIAFVAEAKLFWDFDFDRIKTILNEIITAAKKNYNQQLSSKLSLPKIINKAFSPKILNKLLALKNEIENIKDDKKKKFFLLGLACILRDVSNCSNFAPYLQFEGKKLEDFDVFTLYHQQILKMINDIKSVKKDFATNTEAIIYNKDCRDMSYIENDSIDLVITSPPYLNNWSYPEITRIEMNFFNYIKNDREMIEKLANKLVKSSTYILQNVKENIPCIIEDEKIKKQITYIADKLREIRLSKKNGKKYDVMVIAYFNDMYQILRELIKKMKTGARALIVLGDSGLYGIHVPTDKLIGDIGISLGYELEHIEILRERKATRHNLQLRESVVILKKVK